MAHQWVSVGEAARRLNVSPSTIRRMIDAGKLEGTREIIGGDRDRFLVRFDAPETRQDDPPIESPDAPAATTEAPAVMVELLADLREMRQQQRDDASTIADLRERVGRAESDAEARSLALEWTQARLDQANAELERVRRRRWWHPSTW